MPQAGELEFALSLTVPAGRYSAVNADCGVFKIKPGCTHPDLDFPLGEHSLKRLHGDRSALIPCYPKLSLALPKL